MLLNPHRQMALYNAHIFIAPCHYILLCWLLLGCISLSFCGEADILCLKSIKQSIKDPLNILDRRWNFDNTTAGFICSFSEVVCSHPAENVVIGINLSNMKLQGEFPRGIDKCLRLERLILSRNEFYGSIPSDIDKMLPFVTVLDLSSNKFSGDIPSSIANIQYLSVFTLNNNSLNGNIPPQITSLSRLRYFDVSNNMLSGPLPKFGSIAFSYENNQGLCGEPLSPCRRKRSLKFDFSFKSGFVIGYVVSLVSFVVVFVSYFVPWVDVKEGNQKITIKKMIILMMTRKKGNRVEATPEFKSTTSEYLQRKSKEISMWEKFIIRMSFMELSHAADNFSQDNIIEGGNLGTTYKATLSNGWILAVKRFHNSHHHEEYFESELQILGKLRHRNLVPLLGFSVESNEKLLVYKYMSNGNLYDLLHSKVLEWPLRVKIAVGLARGLSWLHHNNNVCVINLKINSKTILLDRDFEPKISNFKSAVLVQPREPDSTSSSTLICEFMKKDVHRFGKVLLELITGEKGISVRQLLGSPSDIGAAIDNSLIGKGFDDEIFQFVKVVYDCIQRVRDQKPTMLQVYNKLIAVGEKYDPQALAQTKIINANAELEIV